MNILKEQYEFIRTSRAVVLEYFNTIKWYDVHKPLNEFNDNSILSLSLHIANTYFFWLKKFSAGEEIEYFEEHHVNNTNDLIKIYDKVDDLVTNFISLHSDADENIEGDIFWLKTKKSFTVLQLLSHVFTHEFHHKGQFMSMSRILGYTPPDADVIRFN